MSGYSKIEEIINQYDPISLKEMDSVELMNRTDSKYIFNINLLPELLLESVGHFKVLEINSERMFDYTTTYYDTENYTLFNNHMQGKLNRHKVRYRTYESTGVSYLEIKFKSNKNRTIKWRIKNEVNGHFDKNASEFLSNYTHMDPESLCPIITNRFKRITLVSIENKTRITLDLNVSFTDQMHHNQFLPYIAIAEVKQEKSSNNCYLIQMLRKRGIRQNGFSKYCIGSAMMYDIPRRNILKSKFLLINRIKNQYDSELS
jgi:hypothetical protein